MLIRENQSASRVFDPDTLEAICELSAYKLMESQSQPDGMKIILSNPLHQRKN
jgi:hypothetical protein